MVDYGKLEEKIKDSGVTKVHIASTLDITPAALRMKMKGDRDFRVIEAMKIGEILHLTKSELAKIFFADEVT